MKVLVTGHKGYIGSVLVPLLLSRGHSVTGLDADLFAECTYGGELTSVPEIECDVRDADASMLAGYDAIIHLAGLSNDALGDYDPTLTNEINCTAAVNIARLARQVGVSRFLFASSCSTYGASGDRFLDETAPFCPVTPYGESKADVERQLRHLANEKFSPVFLRASTAYGVAPRIRFDLVANNLVAWAFTTGEVLLKSDGKPWRPLVHVEDIALAYAVTLEAPRELIHNRAFNVGSTSENYQVRDIAELVRQIVPGSRIAFAADAAPDQRCYRVDCNLIARTLHDFKPQWTARRGIEQLYDQFSRIGLSPEEFEGKRFKRIAHVKELIERNELDANLRRVRRVANVRCA